MQPRLNETYVQFQARRRECRRQWGLSPKGKAWSRLPKNRARAEELRLKIAVEKRQIVRDYKCNNPCADCGHRFHFAAMDFDHTKGPKKKEVGKMVGVRYSIKALLSEMAKCELVCANCHRIRTYIHQSGLRALGFTKPGLKEKVA